MNKAILLLGKVKRDYWEDLNLETRVAIHTAIDEIDTLMEEVERRDQIIEEMAEQIDTILGESL